MLKFQLPVLQPKTPQTIGVTKAAVTKALVVIDAAVERCGTVAAEVEPDTDTILLNPIEDGMTQITTALTRYRNLEKLHIILFSSPEALYLGNGVLSLETLHHYIHPLMQWTDSLKSNADIRLSGCDFAFDDRGMRLIEKLCHLTGASIALV
ncbi:MAG: DUF4347 domain-containing protein [Cyanobacteriota bacterium]|nr:DUF4347 domain-containing protein [Cyanobacteriota bacterium]